jgi:Tfp pilus assembly protein PilF
MVLAMFFNNLAAEAMVTHQWDRAYALLKVSLSQQPQFIAALNNLAILYRNNHQLVMAERVYRFALQLQPQNLTTLYNFAVLLDSEGRLDEWIEVNRILELERIRNPYYYYGMAQQAYREQRFTDAIHWYRLAIEKADYRHEFYFGLARSYWALGERKQAASSLKKALQLSRDDSWTHRYQAKLNALERH